MVLEGERQRESERERESTWWWGEIVHARNVFKKKKKEGILMVGLENGFQMLLFSMRNIIRLRLDRCCFLSFRYFFV
jgi:hypothetical protein